jgi:hypothetical protein
MTTMTHNPCCSSHGVDMDCAKYRRTHFVEVGNCCDAWARQHPTMPIPDDAAEAFRRVKTKWACEPLASDHYALEAAAPLIVAAELERLGVALCQRQQEMRDEYDRSIRSAALGEAITALRDRAAELRG